jgi:uncharacterized protein Veg
METPEARKLVDEVKDYIDDRVRLSTDSSNKAMTEMLGYLQHSINDIKTSLDAHRNEEMESREHARELMRETVDRQIQRSVNGKIDKIDKKLDIHIGEMQEIKEKFNDSKITKKVLTPIIKNVAYGAGALITITSAWAVFKSWLK